MKLVDTAATTVSGRQLRALRAAVDALAGALAAIEDKQAAEHAYQAIERQVRARRDGGRVVVLTRREVHGATIAWRHLQALLESDRERFDQPEFASLRAFVALLWRL